MVLYLERVAGIEPASLAWKAKVIAVIRHPRIIVLARPVFDF